MLTLVTPPAEEVVSLAEARLHLYQPHTSQDGVISALIAAARRKCERYLSMTLVTSTWDWTVDQFPWGRTGGAWGCHRGSSSHASLVIPNPPLASVTSLNYLDAAGASQTLGPSGYLVTTGPYGRIDPAYGTVWPIHRSQPGAVTVRYVAGFGTAADVPETIKAAILLHMAFLFVNRGDEDMPLPRAITDLLDCESRGAYS